MGDGRSSGCPAGMRFLEAVESGLGTLRARPDVRHAYASAVGPIARSAFAVTLDGSTAGVKPSSVPRPIVLDRH
jgi:hypothetical protein